MTTLARLGVTVLFVLGVAVGISHGDIASTVLLGSFGGVGAYLAARRPGNAIGLLLLATGWGLALGSVRVLASPEALVAGNVDDLTMLSAWANGCGWSLGFIGFMGLALTFPDGTMPRGPWRRPSQVAYAAIVVLGLLIAVNRIINVTPVGSAVGVDIPNPVALAPDVAVWQVVPDPGTLYALMFVLFLVGIASLFARARAATGTERLQYRWFVAGIAIVAITNTIWSIATFVFLADTNGPAWILVVVTYPGVPLAVAVAVLRYRLFEIDRLISRTIAYAVVTGLLVATFAGSILLLQTVLAPFTQGQTIAVAGSTLAVFALFQPLVRRVRATVDRRFDRAGYDAERTVRVFSERLRNEVNIETVVGDLGGTVRVVMHPSTLGLWLRGSER